MRNVFLFSMAATLAAGLIAGCIVSDELTTLTIQPDGSADWIRFQSNIRSTESGTKGAQELKKFVEDFDAHSNSDFARITEAGGKLIEARWVRREEPFANVVNVRFPTAAAVEKFFTVKNDKGEVVAPARFTQDGNRRRISIVIPIPRDEPSQETKAPPTPKELREQQANGFSETRVAVAGGRIVASQGFVVANDKRSCLLDSAQIQELLRRRPEQVELFIAWELDGE